MDHDVKNAWGINGSNILSCKMSPVWPGAQSRNALYQHGKGNLPKSKSIPNDSHSVFCILPVGPLSLLPHSSAALTICSLRAQLLHHTPCFASPHTPPKPEVECKALLAAKAHPAQASASLSANSVSDQ